MNQALDVMGHILLIEISDEAIDAYRRSLTIRREIGTIGQGG